VYELHTAIDIAAKPEAVWSILTNFAAYPEWNPFIRNVLGAPLAGTKLTVRIQPSGAKAMSFRPTVLTAEHARELRWRGRFILPGVFDGEHRFTLQALASGVRFTQSERFSGLLVPLFRRSLETNTKRGFVEMNLALKQRAEQSQHADA
jgi:hypothetical protein